MRGWVWWGEFKSQLMGAFGEILHHQLAIAFFMVLLPGHHLGLPFCALVRSLCSKVRTFALQVST
jgi:hypothetical protein